MESTTRWETAAVRARSGRPRPGVTEARSASQEPAPSEPSGGGADAATPSSAGDATVSSGNVADAAPPSVDPGEDSLLVPLGAWNRMIDQLGNLHEAGRELAEARERAARAETEAAFLRERLAELRTASDAAPAADPIGAVDETVESPPPAPPPPGGGVFGGARRAVRGATGWLRDRRG